MTLLDLIDKVKYKITENREKIKERSIDIFFDDKSKKLKLSKSIEKIIPESLRKYVKVSLRYSFPETREELYRSYLLNTGIFLCLIGLYGLLNNNYRVDHLLYGVLGYSYSIITPTLYYKVDKFREVSKKVIPYI
ncbi:MAG: hypothetical protein ACO2OX_04365 [Candidatus Nanopusillus sp.]